MVTERKPNIVLIITDCLRWDYFLKMQISGKLDIVLTNAYSISPSTFFSIPSILTGTIPFEIIDDARIPENSLVYLPSVLSSYGYKNIFITGNIVTSRYFGYNQGNMYFFEDFIHKKQKDIEKIQPVSPPRSKKQFKNFFRRTLPFALKLYRKLRKKIRTLYQNPADQNTCFRSKVRADEIISAFEEVLSRKLNSPVFAFLHLMDTHAPYGPPDIPENILQELEKITRKLYLNPSSLNDREKEILREMYDKEVEYLDKSLGKLLNLIWDRIGYEDTLVIMLSDHGELLGEDGYFNHPDRVLLEPLLHIPVALTGGVTSNIGIEKESLFSSVLIYYLITNLVIKGKVSIKNLEKVFAVGYIREEESQKYKPYKIFFKSRNSVPEIFNLDSASPIKQKLELLLQKRRRRHLLARVGGKFRENLLLNPGPLELSEDIE